MDVGPWSDSKEPSQIRGVSSPETTYRLKESEQHDDHSDRQKRRADRPGEEKSQISTGDE